MPMVTFTRVALAAAALAFAGAGVVRAAPDSAPHARATTETAPQHPKVEAAQDCETCHRDKTPAVFQRWEKSRHGANSVKCFVCHGALDDKDFTTRPTIAKCEGCHAEQVQTLRSAAPIMKDKTCFSCHDAHALNPHAAAQGGQR